MGTIQDLSTPPSNLSDLPNARLPGVDLDGMARGARRRILIIDDDLDTVQMLKLILRRAGFDVAGAGDHQGALARTLELKPDVILLDLMMPEVDGWSTYQMIRKVTTTPVIIISGSGNRDHAVKSLEMGAEDFIAKPFHTPEIVARINKVVLRETRAGSSKLREFTQAGLLIDFESHEIVLRGQVVHLLPSEFKLLAILAESAPHSVSYETISIRLWGKDSPHNRSHIKNIVFSLRRKFEENPVLPSLLVNYRSVGYQLNVEPDRVEPTG
jgi:two-component system KDP operon response regulator KdpE